MISLRLKECCNLQGAGKKNKGPNIEIYIEISGMELKEVGQIFTSRLANNLDGVFLKCDKMKVMKSIKRLNSGTLV